ncbi:hypothetical protein [uncultured Roseovarius sp.]|uniref:hypothetical protein n=1 Tax=uncultured Roseovarius sp. TaxID=293344 RepID=UPI00262764D9|nr:hypothetical protein [uncultured Roseovarius sp.]
MSKITIDIRTDTELTEILASDERLLWTGHPSYGHGFFQPIGAERTYLFAMCVGALVMWGSVPYIARTATTELLNVYVVYGVASLALALTAFVLASNRQYVLWNVVYLVTDKRAIVCRRGRNWRFGVRLYVVSNPHSSAYPYEIAPTRPYPSLKVGALHDEQEIQPFGLGLSHPGQPPMWGKVTVPVAFEQIPDACEVLELIRSTIRAQTPFDTEL